MLARGLKLKGFEELMKNKEPANSENWNFFDWTFVNEITSSSLIYNLSTEINKNC